MIMMGFPLLSFILGHYDMNFFIFYIFGCGGDNSIKTFNDEPIVQITSHSDGTEFLIGSDIELRAQLSDSNHNTSDLVAIWYADNTMICDWTSPDENGTSYCNILTTEGLSEISVTIRDPLDAVGMDSISVTTKAPEPENTPPTVVINEPIESSEYSDGEIIVFSAITLDEEDAPEILDALWTSSLDGALHSQSPTPDGLLYFETSLSVGVHNITLDVTDSHAATTSKHISLSVLEIEVPDLTCEIITPQQDASYYNGSLVEIEALVTPANDLSMYTYEVISNQDGLLNTGAIDSTGQIYVATSSLSQNTHSITLSIKNSSDLLCESNVDIVINEPLNGKIVFVTSQSYTGDFGGVTGGDTICQNVANNVGLSGTFMAWISGSDYSSSPAARFTPSTIPYILMDGTTIANDWNDLIDGTIQNPINITEEGILTTQHSVFSFTQTDGTPGLFGDITSTCYDDDCHCNNWTNANQNGNPTPGSAVGMISATNDDWTDYSFVNACGPTGMSIYCFQQ